VRIPGFYDHVLEPSPAEVAQLERIAAQRDDDAIRREMGVPAFVKGLTGVELVKRLFFTPTCNICGITAGYQGPGSKTVLPSAPEPRSTFAWCPTSAR
jgi:hypothetical protein